MHVPASRLPAVPSEGASWHCMVPPLHPPCPPTPPLACPAEEAKERLKEEEGPAVGGPAGQCHKRRGAEAAAPPAIAPAAVLAAAGVDLGAAAAAAALQAAGEGAGLAAAGEAAGAAAAVALHPVPIPKSSRFQGVCLCANKRWQAQASDPGGVAQRGFVRGWVLLNRRRAPHAAFMLPCCNRAHLWHIQPHTLPSAMPASTLHSPATLFASS